MRVQVKVLFLLMSSAFGMAQTPFTFEHGEENYHEGNYLKELSLHGLSSYTFQKYLNRSKLPAEGYYSKLENDALLQSQLADLYMELPQAPNRLRYTIDKQLPDPVTIPAILELGGYYYNQRAYKLSVETYEKMNLSMLPFSDQIEPRFRKGYCHFVMKEFTEAKKEFELIQKSNGDYFFHTKYYLGLCEYFMGNLDKALIAFRAAEQTPSYKIYIPYYICQILFKQGQLDELMDYGEKSLAIPGVKNNAQIHLLMGQLYFKKSDYGKALPHLEYFAKQNANMTVVEFYQVGFTYYKNKKYDEATKYFDAIHREKSEYGQLANYFLADCYLKNGEEKEARIAFKKVSEMDYIPEMRDEAAFNYAKLTAALGIEREALNALVEIPETSRFYAESREILADVLEKSSDLFHAINILEKQKSLSPSLKKIYQSKQISAGHKAYLEKNWKDAENHYQKSLLYTESNELHAEALFWKAQTKQNTGDYGGSITTFDQYFNQSKNLILPVEFSPFMANYAQGYNYLKKLNYKKAAELFQKSLQIYERNQLSSNPWKSVANDAAARAGDSFFKERDYKKALEQYQAIIDKKWETTDYALYQKGLLLGLQNEPYEKIVVLKELIKSYKNSKYLDLAYLQIGDTYGNLQSLDNAYTNYQQLVTLFGKTSAVANEARLKSGLIAYNKGDLQAAIRHYKEVLQNNPSPPEVQSAVTGLEEIYINDLGKPDEYLAVLETIPGYKPSTYSSDSLNYKVGEVRFLNGDYEKAIEAFSVYLKKFPNGYYQVQAGYYRGESHAVLKNYAEALLDYQFVIEKGNSSFYESSLKKAALITYNYTNDFKKAYQYYDQYFTKTLVPDEKIWAASGAMRSSFKSNTSDGVYTYGNWILDSRETSSEEKANALYFIGKTFYLDKNYTQSLAYFQKIGEDINTGQAAEARFWIGDILIKLEKWDEAENHCNKANDLNAFYPYWIARTVLLQADIYLFKNDLFSARAAIEAVLENFSDDAGLVNLANAKKAILEEKEKNNNKIKPTQSNQLRLDNRTQN